MSLDLTLQPFRVRQSLIPTEVPNENNAQRHKRIRAQYRHLDTKRYAHIRGIELLADPNGIDSTLAHLGLILATDYGVGTDYSQLVFEGFWKKELNLEKEDEIVSVLRNVGVGQAYSLKEFQPRLLEIHKHLLAQEVFSVPTFLANGERFIGRQHIPMIRRLLEG